MVTYISMPKYDWITTQPKVVAWFKKEGELVRKGEPLFEIETEKATVEVESVATGILRRILVHEGEDAPTSDPVAIIAGPEEELPEAELSAEKQVTAPSSISLKARKVSKINESKNMVESKVRISPRARKIAKEHEIDLTAIKGTGPRGRIVEDDLWKAIETIPTAGVRGKIVPMTAERKAIAERMSYSARTTAHITITTKVDVTAIVRFHDEIASKIKEATERVTYTDIVLKAVASTLEAFPILNSVLKEDGIHLLDDINIGVAIAVDASLVVPVVHNANKKSLVEIAAISKKLIERAKQRKFSDNEVSGGTFTITNLGIFGVEVFTPIINPPQSAILGIGRIVEEPALVNRQIEARSRMPLSLTFDHRVMDGVPAALFLQRLKEMLETPDFLQNYTKR